MITVLALLPLALPLAAASSGPSSFVWHECTTSNKCGVGEGDCDSDNQCADGLFCGEDNCNNDALPNDYDCCETALCQTFEPNPDDETLWNCCGRKQGGCGIGEGDCDYDTDCSGSLVCYVNNCPTAPPGSHLDCCAEKNCNGGPLTDECCTYHYQCGENEGDCDFDYECSDDLICKFDGCTNADTGMAFDCCQVSSKKGTNDDWNACNETNPCLEGQGDCDEDIDCDGDLICGIGHCKKLYDTDPLVHLQSDCCKVESCDGSNTAWDCCNSTHPCYHGEGDCDSHSDCAPGHYCGDNSWCSNSFDLESEADCCYEQECDGSDAAMDCCYADRDPKCGEGEGDCDTNDDCDGDLVCGYNNCAGGASGSDCCEAP